MASFAVSQLPSRIGKVGEPVVMTTSPPATRSGVRTAKPYVPGEVAFNPPPQMYVNQPEVIEVVIGQKITAEMRDELLRLPQVKKIRIPTHSKEKMRAELKASKLDFDIEYLGTGSLEKIVTEDNNTYWSWSVTPKRVGKNRKLTLIASILLTDKQGNLVKGSDGKPIAKDTPIHRQINIDVDPTSAPTLDANSSNSLPNRSAPSAAGSPVNGGDSTAPAGKDKEKPTPPFVERVFEEPLKVMLTILLSAVGATIAARLTQKPKQKRKAKPKEKPTPPEE